MQNYLIKVENSISTQSKYKVGNNKKIKSI